MLPQVVAQCNNKFWRRRNFLLPPALRLLMMAATPNPPRAELARAVNNALNRRQLSVNAGSERLGIDRGTLTRLARGLRPRVETLEYVAKALGEDVSEWRQLAGYEPIPASGEGYAIFVQGLKALAEETGEPVVLSLDQLQAVAMSPEKALETLETLRGQRREKLI